MIRLAGFLLNAHGRASRADFFLKLFLPGVALGIIAGLVDPVLSPGVTALDDQGPFSTIISLAVAVPTLVVGIWRFHDHGLSGWWLVAADVFTSAGLAFVSAVAGELGPDALFSHPMGIAGLLALASGLMAQLLFLILLPGHKGPNRFGPAPAKRYAVAVAA